MNKFRTVNNCSACGKEHRNLEFRQVKREAGGEWSALCPVTGVRIFADKETTEPLPEPEHKPAKKHKAEKKPETQSPAQPESVEPMEPDEFENRRQRQQQEWERQAREPKPDPNPNKFPE